MRTTTTMITALMLGMASCAYAQDRGNGPGAAGGGGGGGPPSIGAGGPAGGDRDAGGDRGGPAAGIGGGPGAERPSPRGEASENHGPGARERAAQTPSPERAGRQRAGREDGEDRRASDKGDDAPRRQRSADDESQKRDSTRKASRERSESQSTAEQGKSRATDEDTQRRARNDGDRDRAKETARETRPDSDAKSAAVEKRDERARHADLSGDKRERVRGAFRDKRDVKRRTHVDIDISVGRRLPRDWDFAPMPVAVIEIVPEYRDYVFVYADDEYVICDPDTYEVVAVIPADGGGYASAGSGGGDCSSRIQLSEDERELILRSVRLGREVDVSDLEVGWSVPGDIELQAFPESVIDEAGELSACRYFVADEQLAVVDPKDDKVVLLIDKI